MLHLHYYPSTAAMAPHIVLQELGVPFELVLVDTTRTPGALASQLNEQDHVSSGKTTRFNAKKWPQPS